MAEVRRRALDQDLVAPPRFQLNLLDREWKFANCAVGGDCNAREVKDGNGVSLCNYLVRGAGYDASCFTGQPSQVCSQGPMGPGNFPNSTGLASNPPSASDATIVVWPTDVQSKIHPGWFRLSLVDVGTRPPFSVRRIRNARRQPAPP